MKNKIKIKDKFLRGYETINRDELEKRLRS
jgi:hypothetical protein